MYIYIYIIISIISLIEKLSYFEKQRLVAALCHNNKAKIGSSVVMMKYFGSNNIRHLGQHYYFQVSVLDFTFLSVWLVNHLIYLDMVVDSSV